MAPQDAQYPLDAPLPVSAGNPLPVSGSDKGIFARIMAGLAAEQGEEKTVISDATYL